MTNKKNNLVITHHNRFGVSVDKRMKPCDMKLLALYLSKINPVDENSSVVSMTLEEYAKIMMLQRYNITRLKQSADNLLSIKTFVDEGNGVFFATQLFSLFRLHRIDNVLYVTIDCSKYVLPYLFHLKEKYVKYELWNILELDAVNHQQLYRILKQYEKMGGALLTIDDLKIKLAMEGSYKKWFDFKRHVLEPCKKALLENTDISFEYEIIKKGRSVHSIKFMIRKNNKRTEKLMKAGLMCPMLKNTNTEALIQPFEISETIPPQKTVNTEFTQEQLIFLNNIILKKYPQFSPEQNQEYLCLKYNEMCMRSPSSSRFGYLKKIIESDTMEPLQMQKTSYDIDKLDKFWDIVPTLD